ncbi:MAG: bifunctional DNA-formamidopyrimidine glycosylase/DNA-(apurinic or apyrimidinic site) lyase [Bacillota bacterium]|nr:bifunctional DNA-formamidopyrimidine glycosylase/DNA-(apurinic or apyrimidinic site) lyase [Bacillota bacterium]
MPEGPEVQTVLSTLENQIKECRVKEVIVRYEKCVQPDVSTFYSIVGQSFLGFSRIGKYLIFTTEEYNLVVHLRMEGKFYILDSLPDAKEWKHIHVIFGLDDGRFLCYHDTRKFGRLSLYEKREDISTLPPLQNVGFDVLDDRVDGMYFYSHIHRSNRNLKSAILDQSIMAGVGNIYADEICFSAGLDPRSRCTRISKKDCENIIYHTKRIIRGAMKAGGTTIRSYTSSLGVTGLFQLKLKVHQREGEACLLCQRPIKKLVVSTRGTYICQNCQKRK